CRQPGAHLGRCNPLVVAALGQGFGDARGGVDAQVGFDQRIFEFLQRVSVELPLAENADDVLRQFGRSLGEAGLEALEPALLLGRLGGVGGPKLGLALRWLRRRVRLLAGRWSNGLRRRGGWAAKAAKEAARSVGRVAHEAHVGASGSPCNSRSL